MLFWFIITHARNALHFRHSTRLIIPFIIYGVQDTNSHLLMHSRQTVCHPRSTPDKLFVTFNSRQTVCQLCGRSIYNKPIIMTYLNDKQIVRPSGCMAGCHLQGLWPFRWHTTMHPSGQTIYLSLWNVMIMSVYQASRLIYKVWCHVA